MARREGDFLKGVLGRLTFRKLKKEQIVSERIVKGTIKHTKETIRSAHTFGMASTLGSETIKSFQEMLKGFQDHTMTYRLNSALGGVLNECRNKSTRAYTFEMESFSDLIGFEFNANSKVKRWLLKSPTVTIDDGKLKVSLNKLDRVGQLRFPAKSFRCELIVSLATFRLNEGLRSAWLERQSVVVLNDSKLFEGYLFQFIAPAGCLCITSLSLEYSIANGRSWMVVNNRDFNPAYICDATLIPGEYKGGDKKIWKEMISFG